MTDSVDVEAVFWDIGGVILDVETVRTAHRSFVETLCTTYETSLSPAEALERWRTVVGDYFRERDGTEFRPARDAYRLAVDDIIEPDAGTIDWQEPFHDHLATHAEPNPDAVAAIETLADASLHQGVISDVDDDEWEVYELVVRRFYATVAEPAEWEHLKVVADVGDHRLKANGKRLVDPGYHAVYPYYSTNENYVPDVDVDDELAIEDVRLEAKQTQPPRRYGQSRLIETMEKMGIGTKATRHETIEKLYDRGYIENDPPRPTALAEAVVEAAETFADHIVSEEMTAQLEQDMDRIAKGEASYEEVTQESREMLDRVFKELRDSREEVGDHLQESLKADKRLGPCPESDHDLLVRRSRRGSYFVGCDGYPDCDYTLPLPSTGKPLIMDETCEEHGLNEVKMLAGRQTFVHGCPQCKADEAGEGPGIGPCPDCGEESAPSETPRDGEASDAAGGELAVKTLRNGSRLVGCKRYPDCDYSVPLPRRGDIEVQDEVCDEHGVHALHVTYEDDDREPWELGCPICNYREYQERESESGTDLESLDGIGSATAEKLKDAGIESVDDLKEADPDTVAGDVQGVSADRVRDWQAEA